MGKSNCIKSESHFLKNGNYVSKSENNFGKCKLLPKNMPLLQYGFHVSDMEMYLDWSLQK